MKKSLVALAAAAACVLAGPAAAENVKIGMLAPFSGTSADAGQLVTRGMDLYVKLNPTVPGGHTIEVLRRDTTGPAPELARRLAQELVARDKVVMLAGFQFSNNASAVMDVVNRAKVPMMIMNAATASLTEQSPYVVRVGRTMWQSSYPLGSYAVEKLKLKKIVAAYSNYAPGLDAKTAFEKSFVAAGGEIVDNVPLPFPQIPDFTPFLQRIKDARPDAAFVFVPSGKYATAFMKTYGDLGLKEAGIKLIGPGDLTPTSELELMGDAALGTITMYHYSPELDTAENRKFVAAWRQAYGDEAIDAMAVQGYDGMAAIYHVVAATNGRVTPEGALEALKGWKSTSPRGPIMIDPASRDIVQNQYVMVLERKDGKIVNAVTDTIPMVPDPWKALGGNQGKALRQSN